MPHPTQQPYLQNQFPNTSEDRLLSGAAGGPNPGPTDNYYSNDQRNPFDTTSTTGSMAYPPRPPLDPMNTNTSAYSSAPSHQPMTPNTTTALAYDVEGVTHGTGGAGGSSGLAPPMVSGGHKLRRPASTGWGRRDEGYHELQGTGGRPGGGGAGGAGNGSGAQGQGRPAMQRPYSSYGASQDHIVLGEEKTAVGKLYAYLVTASVVTRWILFIVPMLGLIWIPGILGLTAFPNKRIWGVKLLQWSIWLSVVWGGWWGALAVALIFPGFIRSTLGVVAVSTRRYIDWMQALHRYIAFFAWTLAIWVSFQPLIDNRQDPNASDRSKAATDLIAKLLFGVFLCSALLLFEKFSIQWIAGKFHERSYAERITDQKAAVRALVTLYKHSIDVPGRSDTLGPQHDKGPLVNPKRIFRKFREGVRFATTTTATVFGNVASEIAGSSVLQPNSPQAIIKTALESANKSRLLARRLFYSFARDGSDMLVLEDIERYFPSKEDAVLAFSLFDKDGNGDVSREEVEMACLEFHREQLSIENSMRDLDSAVGRLDNILMSLYVVISAVILAIVLDAQFTTVITGAGTLVLGLSWLIGGSLQEVLTSIIFLFVKHPFDVGDRVIISKETYTVKEIRLLSTIFLDSSSTLVQAPNNQLNTAFIQNIRRSPQMSESFVFDVNYSTTFEDLERLRERMLAFVKTERRDFQPIFDVTVKDFPEQSKMTLSADIKYKSNAQHSALKAQRRNKWICGLKSVLADLKIFGPTGDPNGAPGVTRYTQVPWDRIAQEDAEAKAKAAQEHADDRRRPADGWKLGDKNAAILDPADDVFGDSSELHMTNPRRGLSQGNLGASSSSVGFAPLPAFGAPQAAPPPHAAEVFEMRPHP